MGPEKSYSTGDIARILGVHIDSVRRFCNNGELKFEKGLLSTHRRIRPGALEIFMHQRGISREDIKKSIKKLRNTG